MTSSPLRKALFEEQVMSLRVDMANMSLGAQQEEDLTEKLGSVEGRSLRRGSLFFFQFDLEI